MSRSAPHLAAVTSQTVKTHCPYCAFQCGMDGDHDARHGDASCASAPIRTSRSTAGRCASRASRPAALLDHPERVRQPAAARARTGAWRRCRGTPRSTSSPSGCSRMQSAARRRRIGGVRQRRADQREGVPARQVRARRAAARRTSTTTAATAWPRRRPGRTAPSASTAACPSRSRDIAETQDADAVGLELRRHDAADHAVGVRAEERGGQLIVVDPRRTETARAARPALAADAGHAIWRWPTASCTSRIERGLVDRRLHRRAHRGLRRRCGARVLSVRPRPRRAPDRRARSSSSVRAVRAAGRAPRAA